MKVLIGTTNPSKVKRFSDILSDCDVEFLTLNDFEISEEPEENGRTPEENAAQKALFYGRFFDKVICNDSGLYFEELSLDDPRQPGLNIRSPKGKRLDDEQMVDYYSSLVRSLGGKVLAYYLDGIAVYNNGIISTFMENSETTKASAFYMVDSPSDKRHLGWPLDSVSINRKTGAYFVDKDDAKNKTAKENIMLGVYRIRLASFLKKALDIV